MNEDKENLLSGRSLLFYLSISLYDSQLKLMSRWSLRRLLLAGPANLKQPELSVPAAKAG